MFFLSFTLPKFIILVVKISYLLCYNLTYHSFWWRHLIEEVSVTVDINKVHLDLVFFFVRQRWGRFEALSQRGFIFREIRTKSFLGERNSTSIIDLPLFGLGKMSGLGAFLNKKQVKILYFLVFFLKKAKNGEKMSNFLTSLKMIGRFRRNGGSAWQLEKWARAWRLDSNSQYRTLGLMWGTGSWKILKKEFYSWDHFIRTPSSRPLSNRCHFNTPPFGSYP